MSPRSGLDWYQENFVSRFSLAWIINSCLFLISAAGTFPSIPFTYFHQEPGTSNQSLIKVSHERISLEVADLLAVRCVVKAFKTRGTEKTRIFTRQGIIYGHPPETQKFSWAIVCPFTVVDGSMLIIERLRYTITPNGKGDFVPRDQVSPLIVIYCLLYLLKNKSFHASFIHKNCSREFFFAYIYSEKFSAWIWRPFHISHNAPYLLPPNSCITFVFHFSWVLQPSQEKLKTMLMQNVGGQIRCLMGNVAVAYK